MSDPLVIIVDASDLEEADKKLDQFVDTAKRAEDQNDRIRASWERQAEVLRSSADGYDKLSLLQRAFADNNEAVIRAHQEEYSIALKKFTAEADGYKNLTAAQREYLNAANEARASAQADANVTTALVRAQEALTKARSESTQAAVAQNNAAKEAVDQSREIAAQNDRTTSSWERQSQAHAKWVAMMKTADTQIDKQKDEMIALSTATQRLLDKYDPLGTKLRSLQAEFANLNAEVKAGAGAGSEGAIDKAYRSLNAEIAKTKDLMKKAGVADGMNDIEKAAGRASHASAGVTRELIVMGREAIRGDFSRMPGSFLVLASRLGLTLSTLASLSLVLAPFILVMGALYVATEKSAEEFSKFNLAIKSTGNFAGTTTDEIRDMALAVSKAGTTTVGVAKDIITELVASGQYSMANIVGLTKLTEQYAAVTGEKAEEVAKKLSKMFEDPAKASEQLNDRFHHLSIAQLEQIKLLQEQGDKQEAVTLAIQTLTDHLPEHRTEVTLLGKAWDGVSQAASGAIDWLKQLGSDQFKLDVTAKRLDFLVNTLKLPDSNPEVTMLRGILDAANKKAAAARVAADATSEETQQLAVNAQRWKTVAGYADDYKKNVLEAKLASVRLFLPENAEQAAAQFDAIKKLEKEIADVGKMTGKDVAGNFLNEAQKHAANAKIAFDDLSKTIDDKTTPAMKRLTELSGDKRFQALPAATQKLILDLYRQADATEKLTQAKQEEMKAQQELVKLQTQYQAAQLQAAKTGAASIATVQTAAIQKMVADNRTAYATGLKDFKAFYEAETAAQKQQLQIQADQQRLIVEQEAKFVEGLQEQIRNLDPSKFGGENSALFLKTVYDLYRQLIPASAQLTKSQADLGVTLGKIAEVGNDYVEKYLIPANKGVLESIPAIDEEIQQRELQTKQIGLTEVALIDLNIQRVQELRSNAELAGDPHGVIPYYDKLIERLGKLRSVTANNESITNQFNAWKDVLGSLADEGAKFIEDFVQHGGSAFKNLWEDFKKWAIAAFAKIAAQTIVVNIATAFGKGDIATSLFGGNNSTLGFLGKLFGGGGTNPNGLPPMFEHWGSMANTVSNWFTGGPTASTMAAFAAPTAATAAGTTFAAASPFAASAGGSALATEALATTATPTLATIGTEAAVGAGTAAAAGAGAGSTALAGAASAIPVVGWVAAAALLVYGIIQANKKPSPVEGQFDITPDDTPAGHFEDQQSTQSRFGRIGFADEGTKQFSGQAAQGFNALIGGFLDLVAARQTKDQFSATQTALQETEFPHAEGTFTTEEFLNKYGTDIIKKVAKAAFDNLDPALSAVVEKFEGTAEAATKFVGTLLLISDGTADLSESMRSNIDAALDGTQENADKVLAFVTILNQFGTTVDGIKEQLKNIDSENITKFIDAMGGAEQALASFQFFDANFTTNAEKAQRSTDNLSKAWDEAGRVAGLSQADFEKAGISGVKTHDDFVKLVDSLDLNTEHGRELRAVLMNDVAPAFVAVAGSAEEAAQKLNAAAQTGLSIFEQNFLTPDEQQARRIERDSTALYELTKPGTELNAVFKELGINTIPTTVAQTRAAEKAIKDKYGEESREYKLFLQTIPVIYDLNEAVGIFGDTASNVANNIVSSTSLMQAGAEKANKLLGQISSLANQGTGDFGQKLTMQVSLIKDALDDVNNVFTQVRPKPGGGFEEQLTVRGGTLEEQGYSKALVDSYNKLTDQLGRFNTLSVQYDAARAEQLVALQDWYAEQQKIFKTNDAALAAANVIFKQRWDAIVNGATDAAKSLDEFIAKIQQLADSTGGDAGQQARLEKTLVDARLATLRTQLAAIPAGAPQTASIQKDIDALVTYNTQLATQIEHFAQYRQQYGVQIANQLVDLENQYEAQKKAATEAGGTAETLAVLAEIFNQRWQEIVTGLAGAGEAIEDFIDRIRGIADSIGDASQQARIEQALVATKITTLQTQLSGLDPTSDAAKAIAADITKLQAYNDDLATQIAHFAVYTAQYNRETAHQLVELENWYNEQKKIIEANGGGGDALAVLAEVFDESWKKIIDSVSGSLSELERLRQGIAEYLKGLQVSNLSSLTPQEQLAQARAALDAEIALARTGDVKALGDVTQYLDRFLQINRDVNASNQQYTDDFKKYTEMLGELAGVQSNGMPIPADAAATLAAVAPTSGKLVSDEDLKDGLAMLANKLIEAIAALADANTADAKEQTEELRRRLVAIEEEISAS